MRKKPLAMFVAAILLLSSICLLLALPANKVEAQFAKNNATNKFNPQNWDERDEIQVSAENVHVVESFQVGKPTERLAPSVADPASVYSTTTGTFGGSSFAPAGQANTPAITKMMADDLTFAGTAPYSIGRFDFSMCNLNTSALSARPRVRFFLDNAGTPGTLITGFSFNAISVAANTCTTLFANVTAFNVASSNIWAGMLFDNSGATATATQVNSFSMGIYPVPDVGTSADTFFLTTAAPPSGGSYFLSNPGPGAATNFSGVPVANFGWDFRSAATITTVVKANTDPRSTGGTAQWTVTTTGGSITGLAPANFALAGTAATGSSITSVVANNFSPTSTNWTVTATIGSTAGTLGLNWANVTGLNTNTSNTLPFAGEVYNVLAPSAATAAVRGRLVSTFGRSLANANVSITNTASGEVRYSRSNQLGYFNFQELEVGNIYVIEVNSKRFRFENHTFTLNEDLTDLVLTAQ